MSTFWNSLIHNTNDISGNPSPVLPNLLNMYDKAMVLRVFVDSTDDVSLKNMYLNKAQEHNDKLLTNMQHIDAGFDLFAPVSVQFSGLTNRLDFKICCAARMYADNGKNFNTGYYMHPRSSLSGTPLRLANSTGIIDAGYRGHLIGVFDVVNSPSSYSGTIYDRYLQVCAPGLVPIVVEIVDSLGDLGSETERGAGGFGSTGI